MEDRITGELFLYSSTRDASKVTGISTNRINFILRKQPRKILDKRNFRINLSIFLNPWI